MRKARRIRIARGLALGLALTALVAPAAQARVDEAGAQGGALVIQGDDKVIVSTDGGTTAVIRGDDKVMAPSTGGATVLVHGDDKVIHPTGRILVGVIDTTPATYSASGYRRALPEDYPTGSVTVSGSPRTFDWGDAAIGAGGAFALLLLAGALAFGVRHRPRPAAA